MIPAQPLFSSPLAVLPRRESRSHISPRAMRHKVPSRFIPQGVSSVDDALAGYSIPGAARYDRYL